MSMTMYSLHDNCPERKKLGCFKINEIKASELNEKEFGIFWTPNEFFDGARQEANLKKLRYWFIDYDSGCKEDMLDKIQSFPLIPTMLIETKNGFHAYWACSEELVVSGRVEEYKFTLQKLVDYFGSDQNAMGVNRLLRVPNYFHCKDSLNKFLIIKVWQCEESYSCKEINDAVEVVGTQVKKIEQEGAHSNFFRNVPHDDFWQKVYNLDCFEYLEKISGQPECNGETFTVERVGSKGRIYVNGELVPSCWIDQDGKIGSHGSGGPTLANWVHWYGHDWDKVAIVLKRCIPELNDVLLLPHGFE